MCINICMIQWTKLGLQTSAHIFLRDTGTTNESPISFLLAVPFVTVIHYLLPSVVDARVDANVLTLPQSSF